ncbi:unnamed protein product [Peronospora farinosa]|uniref:HTH CENPB-type domain-containing protein n=1 Tax=Peronospora farinosa TaxID=134698 RepID=A0AAV0U5I5_9STRA|nr:unnamed protein product [Peronospora farinosa]
MGKNMPGMCVGTTHRWDFVFNRDWLELKHNTKVAQPTILGTLKRSSEMIQMTHDVIFSQKRQRTGRYPHMEKVLAEWSHIIEDRINMSGDLLKESARKILDRLTTLF